jgi:hypothetical protein
MTSKHRSLFVQALIFVVIASAVVAMGYELRDDDKAFYFPLSVLMGSSLYLYWLLGTEIWKEKLTAASFIRPIACLAIFLVGFYLGATTRAIRFSQPRMHIHNDLKYLALSFHEYQDEHGSLPPPFTRSPDGTPLLSWRVLLLPYLEQKDLYSRFHFDEPWDSAHNQLLIAEAPRIYCPYVLVVPAPGMTYYRVFAGPGASFEGDKGMNLMHDFPDREHTILAVEARDAIPWTKPEIMNFDPNTPLPTLGAPRVPTFPLQLRPYLPDVFTATMVDGSVSSFPVEMPVAELRALILRNSPDKPR